MLLIFKQEFLHRGLNNVKDAKLSIQDRLQKKSLFLFLQN